MERIIAHYFDLGATEVMVHWDGAADALDHLARPGLQIIQCSPDFWTAAGTSAQSDLDSRLQAVFRNAVETSKTDWVLIVDADEFVLTQTPFAHMLDQIPAEIDVLRLPNVEAVWGPGDPFGEAFSSTYFRHPFKRRGANVVLSMIYGPQSGKLLRGGLAGHAMGKQLLRVGPRYDLIKSHITERDGQRIGRWATEVLSAAPPLIAHYDALSLDRWKEKFRRRYSGDSISTQMRGSRQQQMDAIRIAAAQSDKAATQLCRRIYGLNRWQYSILKAMGLAFRHPSFP